MSLQDVISENIRVALVVRKKDQKALAGEMGLSPATLSCKFHNKTRWNADDIEKASRALGCAPEALVAGHGFEPWTSGL